MKSVEMFNINTIKKFYLPKYSTLITDYLIKYICYENHLETIKAKQNLIKMKLKHSLKL